MNIPDTTGLTWLDKIMLVCFYAAHAV